MHDARTRVRTRATLRHTRTTLRHTHTCDAGGIGFEEMRIRFGREQGQLWGQ